MYELVQVAENTFYIESPAKIGLVRLSNTDVCLIDSGSDKDAGRKVRQILDKNGWNLKAIYNTHSNADHIGGNRYLQSQTGCRIFAKGIEHDFTNHPVLEPSFLYGGYPVKELEHKFLLAQESSCEMLTEDALPEGFEMIDLKDPKEAIENVLGDDKTEYVDLTDEVRHSIILAPDIPGLPSGLSRRVPVLREEPQRGALRMRARRAGRTMGRVGRTED